MSKLFLIVFLSIGSYAFAGIETISCSSGKGVTLCQEMDDLIVRYGYNYEVSKENLLVLQSLLADTIEFNTNFKLAGGRSVYYDVSLTRKATVLGTVACGKTLEAPSRLFDALREAFNDLMENMRTIGDNSGYYVPTCSHF